MKKLFDITQDEVLKVRTFWLEDEWNSVVLYLIKLLSRKYFFNVLITNYIIVFCLHVRPRLYGGNLSRVEGSLSQPSQLWQVFIWEQSWPLCRSQKACTLLQLSCFDHAVNPAWWAKVKHWHSLRRVTLASQKSDLAGQVGHPSTWAIFCFSREQFATFWKESLIAWAGGWPFYMATFLHKKRA